MRTDQPITVEIFSRPGCHLCEDTLQLIERFRDRYPLRVKVTDVETDPDLEARYGQRLPIVAIGAAGPNARSFEYPIAADELERAFERLWKR